MPSPALTAAPVSAPFPPPVTAPPAWPPVDRTASDRPLQVVHVEAGFVLLDKPSGMLAVPGRGEAGRDCLTRRAAERWPDALIVHRLDMSTSGLLLMARSPAMQRLLSSAFAERRVHKRYLALVEDPHQRLLTAGAPDADDDSGWSTIDLPLAADWPNRPRQRVDLQDGRPSQTRWRALAHDPARGLSRVLLEALTGRTHQLRVHLAAIGHPIAGDALYGNPALAPRLMLHAEQLSFSHPVEGHALQFASPAPF